LCPEIFGVSGQTQPAVLESMRAVDSFTSMVNARSMLMCYRFPK
jgi:hypothetical protein